MKRRIETNQLPHQINSIQFYSKMVQKKRDKKKSFRQERKKWLRRWFLFDWNSIFKFPVRFRFERFHLFSFAHFRRWMFYVSFNVCCWARSIRNSRFRSNRNRPIWHHVMKIEMIFCSTLLTPTQSHFSLDANVTCPSTLELRFVASTIDSCLRKIYMQFNLLRLQPFNDRKLLSISTTQYFIE